MPIAILTALLTALPGVLTAVAALVHSINTRQLVAPTAKAE